MNTPPEEQWEMRVSNAARGFPYPPTPDIATATRTALRPTPRLRRTYLRAAAVIVLVILASILIVPEIRAGVLEFLRIGAVRIFFSLSEAPTHLPDTPTGTSVATLEDAERVLGAAILLPSYPPDLGLPDSVSIVGDDIPVATLIWYEQDGGAVRLVLQMIGNEGDIVKRGLPNATSVEVNGEHALWLSVPHMVEIRDAEGRPILAMSWLIQSNVLVWVEGAITYRLETSEPLDEAIAIAESLQPVSED
jgi:hypothetical protein